MADMRGASWDNGAPDGEVEVVLVTAVFDASDADALAAVLSNYVVLARQEPGCRNIDLCASMTTAGRFVVIEKWASPADQRRHFDGPVMVEMARACIGLLAHPPALDLLQGLSAHDLF